MPKKNSASKTYNDEIDLLDLFRRMGRTLSKWFRAIGRGLLICIVFLMRNSASLIMSLILGIFLSYVIKWSTAPVYRSEITLRSNTVPNSEMISYINKLRFLLNDKNYPDISAALSISAEEAAVIEDI